MKNILFGASIAPIPAVSFQHLKNMVTLSLIHRINNIHPPSNLEYAITSFCCKPIVSRTAKVKLMWRDLVIVTVHGEVCSLVTYDHGQRIPLSSFTRLLQLAEKLTFLVENKYLWSCTFLHSCNCSVLADLWADYIGRWKLLPSPATHWVIFNLDSFPDPGLSTAPQTAVLAHVRE